MIVIQVKMSDLMSSRIVKTNSEQKETNIASFEDEIFIVISGKN